VYLTSSRPKKTASAAELRKIALRRFGGEYGNRSNQVIPPKRLG
jgi:hypothetical protein